MEDPTAEQQTDAEDQPEEDDDKEANEGEKGLGSETGGLGGGESSPSNPDPSTKGTTSENP